MIEKIRKNYGLAVWLSRLIFIFAYVFGNWHRLCGAVNYVNLATGGTIPFTGSYWMVVLTGAVIALFLSVIVRPITRLILNSMQIYYISCNELCIFVLLFFALRDVIFGILCLTYYFTPVISVWGEMVFKMVASIIGVMAFFFTIKKLYLNKDTSLHFFKTLSTLFVVYNAVILVINVMGTYTL